MRKATGRIMAAVAMGLLLATPALAASDPGQAYVASIPPLVAHPPPLGIDGEAVVPDDPTFDRQCLELIPALRKNIRLGRSITTRTRRWGLVLRIDFTMAAAATPGPADRLNRLVFWRSEGGTPFVLIAVGQALPPLP